MEGHSLFVVDRIDQKAMFHDLSRFCPRLFGEKDNHILSLEVNADFASEVPSLKLVAWKALISTGRKDNIHDFLSKTDHQNPASSDMVDVKDINIYDTFWHGHTIFHLTGSRAGFLVLPSLVALVMASLIITASQVTMYACSRGQLNNLQLSSFHNLEFQPWQTRYEVLVDTSFRQVTLVASSDASTTQWILEPALCCGIWGFQQKDPGKTDKLEDFCLALFFREEFAQKGS